MHNQPVIDWARLLIEEHAKLVKETDEALRVKALVPVENQPDNIRNLSEAELVARVMGADDYLSRVLIKAGKHEGYVYVTRGEFQASGKMQYSPIYPLPGQLIEDHPYYLPWRRFYNYQG